MGNDVRIKTDLEKQLETRKLHLNIRKAETAIDELEYKVLEARVQVERLEIHQQLQKEKVAEYKELLSALG